MDKASVRSNRHNAIIDEKRSENGVEAQAVEKDKEDNADADSETVYPPTSRLALLTIGLCLVIFVVALDNTIIDPFLKSLDDVGWYGSSYLLTTTSLQPSFGKIYTYFDVKWTYLSALVLFEIGSIICASATSSPMLIIGRAVAGAGASALFSGGMTIIGFSVPLRKMPIYIAALSSMFGIASVVGPILGGVLTDKVSWRWCFWLNLPFGGVAFLAVFFFFKPPVRDLGNLSLKEKIWGLLLGFGLIVFVFVGIQIYRGDDATIPPRVFIRQRTVFTGAIYTCLLSMGLYTHIYYLPFYFQAVKDTTAEGSGIHSIPYLVSITVSSLITGAIITKIGFYVPFVWFGAAIFTIGAGMLFTLTVASGTGQWIGYQILTGFGAGAGIQVPFLAVQAVLSSKDMPIGNAIIMFFNSLGGAISISIAQNVFTNTLVEAVPRYTTGVDPALIVSSGATHIREVVPADQLQGVLVAYTYALDRAFILPIAVAASAFVISLFMEWNTVKGKKIVHGGAA
ncbi:MFS general substrate transporter [Phellopilus nigrolimitatus]|nr:MFS general substrate transporter [Phellopilus nigrolimitatus]